MAVVIPNLKLKRILELLIESIRIDYTTNLTAGHESESWLYRIFYGVIYGKYNFYTQAKEILLTRDINSPRYLKVQLGFNLEKPNIPTIHINVPSENPSASNLGINGLGMGEDTNSFWENSDGNTIDGTSRGYDGTYELMITSPNEFESELIYRFLQALFQGAHDTLSNNFDGVFRFGGKQLVPNPELFPVPMFIRVFTVSLSYSNEIPKLAINQYLGDVTFTGTPFAEEFSEDESVEVPVTSVSISPNSANLSVGQTLRLTVTISPSTASNKDMIFSSNHINLVTVDEYGKITAKSAGTAIITVTTDDGSFTDTTTITVI